MNKKWFIFCLTALMAGSSLNAQPMPDRKEVLKTLQLVNTYFMNKYADYTAPSFVGRSRPSNIWTRSVYYEGLMALHQLYPLETYYDYALGWAQFHSWSFREGNTTRNADNYCSAQTYL